MDNAVAAKPPSRDVVALLDHPVFGELVGVYIVFPIDGKPAVGVVSGEYDKVGMGFEDAIAKGHAHIPAIGFGEFLGDIFAFAKAVHIFSHTVVNGIFQGTVQAVGFHKEVFNGGVYIFSRYDIKGLIFGPHVFFPGYSCATVQNGLLHFGAEYFFDELRGGMVGIEGRNDHEAFALVVFVCFEKIDIAPCDFINALGLGRIDNGLENFAEGIFQLLPVGGVGQYDEFAGGAERFGQVVATSDAQRAGKMEGGAWKYSVKKGRSQRINVGAVPLCPPVG